MFFIELKDRLLKVIEKAFHLLREALDIAKY